MIQVTRDNNFNLIRLFGAVLVLYGHSYALTGNAPPGFAATSVSTVGVKIFFSISGYLVSLSWINDPHVTRFFIRRCIRIFPALLTVVLLTALVAGPLLTRLGMFDYFTHPLVRTYLLNAGLYINYFLPAVFEKNTYPNAINGSLWSLSTEFSMYIFTPIILCLCSILNPILKIAPCLLLTAGIFLAYQANLGGPQWVVYATDVWASLSLAPYFIIGMMFAVSGMNRYFNIYAAFGLLFILAVLDTSAIIKEILLILVLPYCSLSFATGPNFTANLVRKDLSYGMFLYGFLVQQIISNVSPVPLGPWAMFGLSLALTAVPAWCSWEWIEKPALTWKPIPPRGSPAAATPLFRPAIDSGTKISQG